MAAPQHLAPPDGPPFRADGVGTMEGARLGTSLTLWIALDEGGGGRIARIAWRSVGVPELVPAASAVSAHLCERGMDATSAAALAVEDVADLLGGIPIFREGAVLRVLQALRRALADAGVLGAHAEPGEDDRACYCVGISFADLRAAAAVSGDRLNLQRRTGFGSGCGTCVHVISAYLDDLEEAAPDR